MRAPAPLLLLACLAGAALSPEPIDLLDLQPGFVRGGKLLRNRVENTPGITLQGKRYRGLNGPVPLRMGYDLDGAFERATLSLGVIRAQGGVTFRLIADGKVLVATPPLFAGAAPLEVSVALDGALLFEIEAQGGAGGRAAIVEGRLFPAAGKEMGRFLAFEAPFSPQDYPTAFRRRVNEAIDAGAGALRRMQGGDGGWSTGRAEDPMGPTALILLALLKAGVKPGDPAVERAFAYLRGLKMGRTYGVSCLLMALEAKYFPGGADEHDAYKERPRLAKTVLSEEDRAWIKAGADWLVEQQGAGFPGQNKAFYPVWRYPQGGYDLSNTQYALFGLASANRCGVATSRAWLPALRFLLGVQEKEGPPLDVTRYVADRGYLHRRKEKADARGFTYTTEGAAYGSMTSAGLCSLVLCQQALERNGAFQTGYAGKTRAAIRDALAWLQEYYDLEENVFRGSTWWTYYLFNIERAGSLLDMRFIGTRDWYQEGAELLMATQTSDGNFGSLIDTAFAVLFLKRATVPALTNPLR
ncbi:MAG: NPCBM/NEW2 domain-containing protein [Planctomycetaceae bacterium]